MSVSAENAFFEAAADAVDEIKRTRRADDRADRKRIMSDER